MKGVKDSRLATEMREEQSSVACHPAFGNDTTGMLTLPVMLYHQLGAYRFNEAAVTALVLIVLCALVFIVVEHLVGQWRS